MVNITHIGAVITAIVGGLFLGAGVVGAVDAWATMQQIEAQGLIGQAVYESEYESAANSLRWFVLAASLGFAFLVGGSIEYLRGTVKELASD